MIPISLSLQTLGRARSVIDSTRRSNLCANTMCFTLKEQADRRFPTMLVIRHVRTRFRIRVMMEGDDAMTSYPIDEYLTPSDESEDANNTEEGAASEYEPFFN